MKNSIFVLFLVISVIVVSGCSQLDQLSIGISNIACLVTADTKCVQRNYFPENTTEEKPVPITTSKELELQIQEINVIPTYNGHTAPLRLVLENVAETEGGRALGFLARDITLVASFSKNFTVEKKTNLILNMSRKENQEKVDSMREEGFSCSTKSMENGLHNITCKMDFEVPTSWSDSKKISRIELDDMELVDFSVPTTSLDPESTSKYRKECMGYICKVKDDFPRSYDLEIVLDYDYGTYTIFPYKVYEYNYFKSNIKEVDDELKSWCEKSGEAYVQRIKPENILKTPVRFDVSTNKCRIFEDEDVRIDVTAETEEDLEFKITDDSDLKEKGCYRVSKSDSGDKENVVEWYCDIRTPSEVSLTGETFHFEASLKYHVKKKISKRNILEVQE